MKTRLALYAAGAAILFGAYWAVRYRIEQNARGRAEGSAMIAEAKLRGGIAGKRVSARVIEKGLSPGQLGFVHAIQKVVPKARVDSSISARATISDTAKSETIPATADKPAQLCDEYGRFCFELPAGLLTRRQDFQMNTVLVRSPDGKTRVARSEFFEFRPGTAEVIPTTGVEVKTEYQFLEEKPTAPAILHLRALAAVDHRIAPGAGVEFVNFERTRIPLVENLTLSALGYWKTEKTEKRVVGQLGYRIPGSNVALGGYLGAAFPSGELVIGAGAAIAVTR